MKRHLVLVVFASLPFALVAFTGCKKPAAGADGGDDAATDAAMMDDGGPDGSEDAGMMDEAAAPLATAAKTAAVPTGGAFHGTYTCFGGMKLTQTGNTVNGRLFPQTPTSYSTINCAVSSDTCVGMTTSIAHPPGKPPKVIETRKATLKLNASTGDISFRGDGTGPSTLCKKQ